MKTMICRTVSANDAAAQNRKQELPAMVEDMVGGFSSLRDLNPWLK